MGFLLCASLFLIFLEVKLILQQHEYINKQTGSRFELKEENARLRREIKSLQEENACLRREKK